VLAYSHAIIHTLRPAMSFFAGSVVDAILLAEGPIGSAKEVAKKLGLPNRFKLARMLKQEGLPPLHRLAEWATIESWVSAAERDGVSLCHLAFRCKKHPSACYRLVKETTGSRWEKVRARGSRWVQRQLRNQLRQALIDHH
jgi:hypothetical protein